MRSLLAAGLVAGDTGTAGERLIQAWPLRDDPETSHPYHRAGFAAIGDGTRSTVQGD